MSIRTERVARLIQRDVADILQSELGSEMRALTTVTGVRMTKDLGIAYVDVSIFGTDKGAKDAAFRRLQDLTPRVRSLLAGRLRHQIRAVPEVRFFLDDSLDRAAHMDDVFAQIARERGEAPADPASEDGDAA